MLSPKAEEATGILFPRLCNGMTLAGCGVRVKWGFVKVRNVMRCQACKDDMCTAEHQKKKSSSYHIRPLYTARDYPLSFLGILL